MTEDRILKRLSTSSTEDERDQDCDENKPTRTETPQTEGYEKNSKIQS